MHILSRNYYDKNREKQLELFSYLFTQDRLSGLYSLFPPVGIEGKKSPTIC